VEPSWLVSAGLVLLAALPHQIPQRQVLLNPVGAILFLVVAAWVTTKRPVLGMAMLILLASVWILPEKTEGFVPALNVDAVQKKKRWLEEEIMSEEPTAIQERTEDPALLLDRVGHEERDHRWFEEHTMEEHPAGIQEKPVGSLLEYDH
jgi:hypothetical protein